MNLTTEAIKDAVDAIKEDTSRCPVNVTESIVHWWTTQLGLSAEQRQFAMDYLKEQQDKA